jgi:hypothetical protein
MRWLSWLPASTTWVREACVCWVTERCRELEWQGVVVEWWRATAYDRHSLVLAELVTHLHDLGTRPVLLLA